MILCQNEFIQSKVLFEFMNFTIHLIEEKIEGNISLVLQYVNDLLIEIKTKGLN